ncbi:hypothetical protein cand_028360 [Cryptosporidium andersoni]|uniref:Uncharacterized protein n=1 Tax=Cryptosporidium andersoni TaxID=117008 RepID=A0A1J4MR48_9CRYT|nr:hypothetical protein cand_028360 [Cryptosporidium andersoni]
MSHNKSDIQEWLDKQIAMWNGYSIPKISNHNKFIKGSIQKKVDMSSNTQYINENNCISKNVQINSISNEVDSNGHRLKFKDWADLHQYLKSSLVNCTKK